MSLFLMMILASLIVLYRYVIGYDPDQASSHIVIRFLDAMRSTVLPAILAATVIMLFFVLRRTDRPLPALLALGIACTVSLVIVATIWTPFEGQEQVTPVLPERRVVAFPNTDVYVESKVGDLGEAGGPVFIHQYGHDPGSEIIQEIAFDRQARALIVVGRPDLTLSLDEMTGSYSSIAGPPARLVPLLRDLESLNGILLARGVDDGRSRVLLAVALGVMLLACWTPARLTRWPLFNAILVFAIVRGVLWLLNQLYNDELGRLLMSAIGTGEEDLLAAGVMAFVAVVFLVSLFLLQPLSSWKRELGDG